MMKFDYLNNDQTAQRYLIVFKADDGYTAFLFAQDINRLEELKVMLDKEGREFIQYEFSNWEAVTGV